MQMSNVIELSIFMNTLCACGCTHSIRLSGAVQRQRDSPTNTQFVLAPLRLLGARYMPRLRNTFDADERFWVTTGLGKTWLG